MNIDDLRDTVLCGNALDVLKTLPSNSVQMCVTSPPYYGLRDYGCAGQIGCEQSPFEYIEKLTDVFREVHRVLKMNGTLWLNIADSYAGSNKGVWSKPISERPKSKQSYNYLPGGTYTAVLKRKWDGIKKKDMIGIPWLLAFSLRANCWYLRSDIIWQKPNCLPESVKDRPTKSYEHIFLLSKSPHYHYDYKAISEPISNMAIKRNKRDIWSVSTNSHRNKEHFAMYPEKLIEPCILAGSPEHSIVLDPFFGSGTTGIVCARLSRSFIGVELNAKYYKIAKERIKMIKEELRIGS